MKKSKYKKLAIIIIFVFIIITLLVILLNNKKEPVSLTMWHVYGEQASSPMDKLVDDFNETVGSKEGIVINVTATSNSAEIGDELLDSQAGKSGAKKMPDLFFCHSGNADDLGSENLIDWQDYFTKEELSDYQEDFLEDGKVGDKLLVFPISKSTHMLFINGSMFARFSEETGISYDDLVSWDGFFDAAEKFYDWSDGKAFCAMDYILREIELANLSTNPNAKLHNDHGWYDKNNMEFKKEFDKFMTSLVKGHIIVSDLYANTQMMTGETLAGISSSAAVLYYNDTVTYPDNRSEPMDLKVLALPINKSGNKFDTLAGTGLCAYKTTDEKAKAAAIFAKWITESGRNLDFVTKTGYMPVRREAFKKISSMDFENNDYRELYNSLSKMQDDYTFLGESYDYNKVLNFYDWLRANQKSFEERYKSGEDVNSLIEECWEKLIG
uniref:ABC transporter substrate-binding protein n=1 Tax=Anaerococcus mediterraneensis TaxID=1870984 RepID=UPI0009310D90|nr:extracellular solute-binding protein [Anaerococcus mediterraneensis]